MDFTRAEYEADAPASGQCAACKAPLQHEYWTAGNASVCGRCAELVKAGPPPGGGVVRAFKALMLGSGAGLLGAVGYGLIIHFARMELALVTIFIGWFVGRAVKQGSEGRGGRLYQVMGAVLTYGWCMMAYVPDIVLGAAAQPDAAPTVVLAVIAPFIALAVPFTGEMGVLGTLILAFGVWRGWREPARVDVVVSGPYALAATELATAEGVEAVPVPVGVGVEPGSDAVP